MESKERGNHAHSTCVLRTQSRCHPGKVGSTGHTWRSQFVTLHTLMLSLLHKAFRVPHLSGRVHHLILHWEAVVAPDTNHVLEAMGEIAIDVVVGIHSATHHLSLNPEFCEIGWAHKGRRRGRKQVIWRQICTNKGKPKEKAYRTVWAGIGHIQNTRKGMGLIVVLILWQLPMTWLCIWVRNLSITTGEKEEQGKKRMSAVRISSWWESKCAKGIGCAGWHVCKTDRRRRWRGSIGILCKG